MVAIIPRHPFPTENAEATLTLLEERAATWIGRLEGRPTALGSALSSTLLVAQARCIMDPRGAIYPTWDSWVTAMQVGSAVFAAATTTEAHVQCRIAHKDLTLEATGPQPYVTPAAWVTAFHLAVVCRERDRITALCRVPLSLLRENGGVTQEDRSQLITGLVALAPLAMACFAREAGISKSDYLPAVLLNGNWLGEFPT